MNIAQYVRTNRKLLGIRQEMNKEITMKALFVLITCVVFLAGCAGENLDTSNPAVARDEIFSVEPRVNGTYTIWLVHDDISAYCATDKSMGETALKAIRGKSALVVINYLKGAYRLDDQGCVAEGAKYIYKIISLEVLPQ